MSGMRSSEVNRIGPGEKGEDLQPTLIQSFRLENRIVLQLMARTNPAQE
jgi:hypothetical protein